VTDDDVVWILVDLAEPGDTENGDVDGRRVAARGGGI